MYYYRGKFKGLNTALRESEGRTFLSANASVGAGDQVHLQLIELVGLAFQELERAASNTDSSAGCSVSSPREMGRPHSIIS